MRMRPAYSSASSSSTGATARHGPHHGAQKSTRTGRSELRTVEPKESSVTATVVRTGSDTVFSSICGFCLSGAGELGGRRRGVDGCFLGRVGQRGEVVLRVQRGRTAGPCGGDRLPVRVV